jgi:hypothetical protein
MLKLFTRSFAIAVIVFVFVCHPQASAANIGAVHPSTPASYGKLPLSFEANQGQSDGRVKFLARGQGYGLFLTPTEAVLSLRAQRDAQTNPTSVVRMRLVGANRGPQLTGLDPQPGKSNYFIGNDPAQWRRDVPNYARVKYAQVYPGVDLIYHGNQRQLEYDFVVAPGADPSRIEIAFKGVDKLSLDAEGNLVLAIADGNIVQHKPIVYQDLDGERRSIDGRYVLRGRGRASFSVASYDTAHQLVIDPVLVYSSHLGGAWTDEVNAIALDSGGNAYVTGMTASSNFPVVNQISIQGGVFVTKINAAGNAIVYSTYLGGTQSLLEEGRGIAVDGAGSAYVTGWTTSIDFPLQGEIMGPNVGSGSPDVFVSKLSPSGNALVYSTYLGGSGLGDFGRDEGNAIAVDAGGFAYVTGRTYSTNFPTTNGSFQPNLAPSNEHWWDAFVAKLSASGSALVYSTFLGGTQADEARGIAVDGSGNAYVTGYTFSTNFPTMGTIQTYGGAFLTKLNAAGSALVYSTHLGGSTDGHGGLNTVGNDGGNAVALDSGNNAYVTGYTRSDNFWGTASSPIQSTIGFAINSVGFVAKVNAAGSAVVYATYLGGTGRSEPTTPGDVGNGIAVDSQGNAYVAGTAYSTDFPTADPIQANNAGSYDAFITKVNAAGTMLVYSTYLGGAGADYGRGIAVDSGGNAYVVGATQGGFPQVAPFQAYEARGPSEGFVAKISPLAPSTTSLISSLNPSIQGQSVTFTASVSGTGVTGAVQFKDGASNLGSPVTLVAGAASYMTSALTTGFHSITAVYGGDSTFYTSTSSLLSQQVYPPFGTPGGLVATTLMFSTQVLLTWNFVGGVDHYEVARSSFNGPYVTIGLPVGATYFDSNTVANTTYLYKVRAVDSVGTLSGYSNVDPATTVFFTDDPLIAGSTIVKAAHVNELRTAANAMRAAAGLTPAIFTDLSLSSSIIIQAVHMQEIRTALDEARSTLLLLPPLVYTEGTLTPTVSVIKAAFVQQMRDGTK